MTTLFLVRHAAHPLLDRVLVGRMSGVRLSKDGKAQAEQLGRHFAEEAITWVQSSPRDRALETAEPIAARTDLPVEISDDLDEIDLGEWAGRSFADLRQDPAWHAWNAERSKARPPGGESMAELQRRVIMHLSETCAKHRYGRVVVVSHAEVIRAALLYHLRLALDRFTEIEIMPGSIATLDVSNDETKVLGINQATPT